MVKDGIRCGGSWVFEDGDGVSGFVDGVWMGGVLLLDVCEYFLLVHVGCGIDIRVLDDELAEALKKLPERKRNTLLMYYFLEMTESEIANLQKITQSGVFRNRHHALETMKKILKEKQ